MRLPLTALCDHGRVTARRRPRAQRRAKTRPQRTAPRPAPVVAPSPSSAASRPLAAEPFLLELARTLAKHSGVNAAGLAAAVEAMAAAYAPDAPLALALRADALRTADDKTARLALGWAREHVRLALVEILQRASDARVVPSGRDAETLAWLWLAACEALAHELPSAVADRVHALLTFLTERERVLE